jgi:phosphorylase/glycogen(starch) synthase
MATSGARLFETCWEVCNKVGGMHTVVTSKLHQVQAEFGSRYLAIGPYLAAQNPTFREEPLPVELQGVANALAEQGVHVHYGHWLISGEPATVLLDWQGLLPHLNDIKSTLWQRYQLDTLGSNFYDIDQPLLWSTAVGMFCRLAAENDPTPLTVQVHEWMSAGTILELATNQPTNVRTVFTTHATVLGRALCSQNVFIYDKLDKLNPAEEARRLGVGTKHHLEALAAQKATIFTTVSKITAEEGTAFLGRQPDVITENGLDLNTFPLFDTLAWQAKNVRQKIESFLQDYFAPSYALKTSNYVLHCTMGRYEVHNKGYDLYLQSLGEINQKLQGTDEKGIIALFFVPGDYVTIRPEVSLMVSLHRLTIDKIPQFPSYLQVPASPYILRQGGQETITSLCKQYGLLNRQEDKVKVIFFPAYFNGLDGIFNEHIYNLVSACDLGVFPSLYEPWGYTPLEAIALGVPVVTSDLAGFGRAIGSNSSAVFTIDRRHGDTSKSLAQLTSTLNLSRTDTQRSWVERKITAYHTAQNYSWERLYSNYEKAYHLAWN